MVGIDSVTIGDVVFANVQAASWDRPRGFGQLGARGVLGIPLFSDFLVTFDFPSGEFVLEPGELPPADNKEIIPYKDVDGIISFDATIGGRLVEARLDTGSPGDFTISEALAERLPLKASPVVIGKARTINGDFEISQADLDGDIRVGSFVEKNPTLRFLSAIEGDTGANVGSGFMRDFVLTLDQNNHVLRYRRP